MKKLIPILTCILLTGCTTATAKKLSNDLKAFDSLGVQEIIITGKFSHTDYEVTHADGKRTATINHTNIWVPQIKVVRTTVDVLP